MNIISDLENSICVLESVLKRAKIQYAIAKDKQRVFETKKDKLQDNMKLVLYNLAKQKSIDGSPDSIDTYVEFLEEKIKNIKQEIQQVECDISTSELNMNKSVAACKELLDKIEKKFA